MKPQQHCCEILQYGWPYAVCALANGLLPPEQALCSVELLLDLYVTIHLLLELDQPRKSVQFSEAVQVKTVEEPQEVEINEEKIDRWDHIVQGVCIQKGCNVDQLCRNR